MSKNKHCECGCGARVKNRFVRGHSNRCRTEATLKRLSKSVSKAFKDPAVRKMLSERMKLTWKHRREQILESNRKTREDPTWKKWFDGIIAKRNADPVFQQARFDSMQTPEHRANLSRATTKAWEGKRGKERRKACTARALANKIKVECTVCGVTLLRNKYNKSNLYFCSRECGLSLNFHLSCIQNTQEKKLGKIIAPYGFIYVGNNRKTNIGGKFPDFIHKEKKVVVELFGEYWHKLGSDIKRIKHFKHYGYKCCVIWSKELHRTNDIMCRVEKCL